MSKAVNTKWKKTFPDTIGNQNRPANGVDDTQPFETGAFPQYMANDPVRYDLQNAAMSQSMSNDARLKEMVDARGKELDDHKVDPGAHKTGIAGNAATATKVVTTAATGASANIAEASMGGSDSARIRVSGAENAGELALETADDGSEPIVARQYTGIYTTPVRTAKILDESGNTSFPGTVVAPKFTGAFNGNAATATKLATPRTISLTGKAAGSATFDGAANASINVTSVNADTASKLSTARKINITGNATGAATFDGTSDVSINVSVSQATNATSATKAESFVGGKVGGSWVSGMNQSNSIIQWTMAGVRDGSRYDPIMWGKDTEGNVWNLGWAADGGVGFSGYKAGRTDNGTDGGIYFDPKTGITRGNFLGTLNGNSATATKLATARAISLTGNASGSANFDGSGNVSINTTVSMAAVANSATKLANNGNRNDLANGTKAMSGLSVYQCYLNTGYPQQYGNVVSIGGTGDNELFLGWADDSRLLYRAKRDNESNWKSWRAIAFTDEINNYAPTKTGSGATGTWGISISGNAATATTANSLKETLDRPASANVTYNDGKIRYFLATNSMSEGKPSGGDGPVIHLSWDRPLWETQIAINNPSGHIQTRAQDSGTWGSWKTVLDSDNFNNYAPTKTGSGASGTWDISITGNATSATNADKVDGYHASDLLRTLGGNRTPVITDIFDRAGTIDMSTMSAADKATHKANINKARNASQNIWNTDTGIAAYGGDYDMANGYGNGSLKLTQSYKNFDKILVVGANDRGELLIYKLWDVWALANAFAGGSRFQLFHGDDYWFLFGNTRRGTATNYALSTDTVWSCQDQNSAIVAIYGIKY